MWSASFIIVGPEYLAMAAAEVKRPRIYLKTAFTTVYWRFAFFFIGGALCVGIVTPYNSPTLAAILEGKAKGAGTAAASPYVIAMSDLGIGVLPHITNALISTSIFSAGNTYTYTAIRSLYGLALEGRAPAFLKKCTKNGVPIYCFAVAMIFPLLSFLQLSSGTSTVLTWLINLVTAGCVIDYIVMCVTFIYFYRACRAQGIDRKSLPYYGYFQPYCAYAGAAFATFVVMFYGYSSFTPWSVSTFFSYYAMVIVAILTYGFWKIFKKTKVVGPLECDLTWKRPQIDAHEILYEHEKPVGFWGEVSEMFGWKMVKN
jgi:amino acid transporter